MEMDQKDGIGIDWGSPTDPHTYGNSWMTEMPLHIGEEFDQGY